MNKGSNKNKINFYKSIKNKTKHKKTENTSNTFMEDYLITRLKQKK